MLRSSYPIEFCDWENQNRPHKRTCNFSYHINGYNRIFVICISSCSRKNSLLFFFLGMWCRYLRFNNYICSSIFQFIWNTKREAWYNEAAMKYLHMGRVRFIASLGYIVHPKEKLSFKKLWIVLSMHKWVTPVRRSVVRTTNSYPYIHLWDVWIFHVYNIYKSCYY